MKKSTPAKHRLFSVSKPATCILFAILLGACTNPLSDTIYKEVAAIHGTTADCALRYGYGISPTFAVPITFSGDMDKSSLLMSGTMGDEAVAVWSNTRNLYITPRTAWSSRADHTISVTCKDSQGFSCSIDRAFGILDGTIYVSPNGHTWSCGRRDDPLDTIVGAVWMASDIYPDDPTVEIHVAEGTYVTSALSEAALGMFNAQKLYGGYSLDFSARDHQAHPTIIGGRSDATGSGGNTAVMIDGCGPETVVDGFTIITGATVGSVGVWLNNSSARLSNNIINLYAKNGAGIYLTEGSAASITNNTLVDYVEGEQDGLIFCNSSNAKINSNRILSTRAGPKTGVLFYNSQAIFSGNEIRLILGNASENRIGLSINSCSPIVFNNVIDAGVGFWDVGILNESASPKILNNTIYAGCGLKGLYGNDSKAYAIYDEQSGYFASQPAIINNLIFAGGENEIHAIYHASAGSTPVAVSNNCFSGFAGTETSTYDASNDIRQDLYNYLVKPAWTFQANVPAKIQSGGQDLSASYSFSADKAGTLRPGGAWSMGAYQ